MSSSEELSQYEEPSTKTSKSLQHKDISVIPRDMYGLYGVHVSNLPSGISEELLEKTFSSVGKVAVCKVMDPKTHPGGSFPIYAFVKFSSRKEACDALSKFDGYTLNDSILAVRPAYVSQRIKRNQPQRHRRTDVFSNQSEINGNANKEQETPRKSYVMSSSDCRLRDGKLQEGDVVVHNGSSAKSSPTKGCTEQKVAPQFRKSSSPDDSKKFRVVCPEITSDTAVQAHQKGNHDRSGISFGQTSDRTDSCSNTITSAFHLYQGTSGIQKQLPTACNVQPLSTVENGFTQMNSDLSHLQLSPSSCCSTENYPQGSEVFSWRGDVPQGATVWNPSPSGDTAVAYFSDRNKPANSSGRSCQSGSSVASWSTTDVVQFFYNTDCAEYAGFFQEQEIDGRALMLLNRDTLLQFLKVGPALKILQKIGELRSTGSSLVTGVNGW
ncbi:polycomb protein Scm-like [Stylophora pistillata]|uniref:polycomb protein Scm-like n=1 Tax=Stylophora pistillata TaxID=50429 RepID=UPI000C04B4DA|nr:polycomb protein Scm-like [Stylophora pistillata]